MGTKRRLRALGESTFLEYVKDLLERLQADVDIIKQSVGHDMKREHPPYPPPPAPPQESYDRDLLLRYRSTSILTSASAPLEAIGQEVVMTGMKDAQLEEDEQLTKFLIAQGHYGRETPDTLNDMIFEAQAVAIKRRDEAWQEQARAGYFCAALGKDNNFDSEAFVTSTPRQESQHLGIRSTNWKFLEQFASGSRPLVENQTANASSAFNDCRNGGSVAPLPQGFTSAKACGPHPGRQEMTPHRLEIQNFMELMKPFFDLSAEEMQAERWTPADSANFLCHKALIMARQKHIDESIARGFQDEVLEATRVKRDQLKLTVGRDPHFICQDCAFVTEAKSRTCMICNGTDVFDDRQCVCGNSGICGIGDCRRDWSESEFEADDKDDQN